MTTQTATKHKLDVFKILGQLNNKDVNHYSELPEDLQKTVHPLLLQRWLSGTSSARQIMMLNEISNPYIFSLYKHKDLLWKLLTVTTPGHFCRYTWTSQKQNSDKRPVATSIVKEYYKYSSKHAQDAVKLLSYDHILALAQELGRQQDDLTKLKKEYDTNASTKATKKKQSSSTT